jgi:hypothetical protein
VSGQCRGDQQPAKQVELGIVGQVSGRAWTEGCMIEWYDNADEAQAAALRVRRPILIDVSKEQ